MSDITRHFAELISSVPLTLGQAGGQSLPDFFPRKHSNAYVFDSLTLGTWQPLLPPPIFPYGQQYFPERIWRSRDSYVNDDNATRLGSWLPGLPEMVPGGQQYWPDPMLFPRVSGHAAQDTWWLGWTPLIRLSLAPKPPGQQYFPDGTRQLASEYKLYKEILPDWSPLTLTQPATGANLSFSMIFEGNATGNDLSVTQVKLQNLKIK